MFGPKKAGISGKGGFRYSPLTDLTSCQLVSSHAAIGYENQGTLGLVQCKTIANAPHAV